MPLATSEAALVASYGRGAEVATEAGGITAAMIGEGVLRTPAFVFAGMLECRPVRRLDRRRMPKR